MSCEEHLIEQVEERIKVKNTNVGRKLDQERALLEDVYANY